MKIDNLVAQTTEKQPFPEQTTQTNIVPVIVITFVVAFLLGAVSLSTYNKYQASIVATKTEPQTEVVTQTTTAQSVQVTTPQPTSVADQTSQTGKIRKEFPLGTNKGISYKLVWMEIPVAENEDSPSNKDSLNNAKEPVSLYSSDSHGAEKLIKDSIFNLGGARFDLPCVNFDESQYFPETAKHYKEVCSKLSSSEIFITSSHGWTDGRDETVLNLETGVTKSTAETNQ
jgi:hypothetical protein